ncbi:dimethyl sulfoxide reductase anchor subunit family protein [Vibrio taketomensis]|uniref:dimethyl sulfoxide reductase anchor subunit family protein n=1 Tax=Vibrio taketomensis TaxID=2572923 RepID=UPI00138979B9|nr:DmsC/YnfH family molybdoenzyme membrane anchor subunit [Vibrio taketomensis]
MLYEAPLVAFTVLAQTAVGAHLTLNAVDKANGYAASAANKMNIARFVILAVMAVGFMFSTTHLGSPLRAFNALNRVGSAALSNEILTGASFLSFAGLAWLMMTFSLGGKLLAKLVNGLSMIIGVVFMFAMANVYQIPTVPAWHSPMTTLSFWFTVATSGVLFTYVMINLLNVSNEYINRKLMWLGASFIALNIAFAVLHTLFFADISTAIHSGAEQITMLLGPVVGHVLLMVVALVIWIYAELYTTSENNKNLLIVVAFFALFIAQLLGRNVFYGMHFTVGLY